MTDTEVRAVDAALRDVRDKRLLIDQYDSWLIDLVRPYFGRRLLEVGCGWGNVLRLLSGGVEEIVAIDVDQESVDMVQERFKGHRAFRALQGDICDAGAVEAVGTGFDTVLSVNVLEHVEDDLLALRHMTQLLAPGGFLVAIVPAHARLHNRVDRAIGHYRRYSKADMASKLEHIGCEVEMLHYVNAVGAIGWLLNGALPGDRTMSSSHLKLMNTIIPVVRRLESLAEPPFGVSLVVVAR